MTDLQINIIQPTRSRRTSGSDRYDVYVNANAKGGRIHLSPKLMKTLDLEPGKNAILVGHAGSHFFVAKRMSKDDGMGYSINKATNAESYYISNMDLKERMASGIYKLGQKTLKSGIMWFELDLVELIKPKDNGSSDK